MSSTQIIFLTLLACVVDYNALITWRTNVLPISLRTRGEDIPSVLVLGSSIKTVTRSRSTSLRMIAEAGACGEADRYNQTNKQSVKKTVPYA